MNGTCSDTNSEIVNEHHRFNNKQNSTISSRQQSQQSGSGLVTFNEPTIKDELSEDQNGFHETKSEVEVDRKQDGEMKWTTSAGAGVNLPLTR